jgi:hypothetical protein
MGFGRQGKKAAEAKANEEIARREAELAEMAAEDKRLDVGMKTALGVALGHLGGDIAAAILVVVPRGQQVVPKVSCHAPPESGGAFLAMKALEVSAETLRDMTLRSNGYRVEIPKAAASEKAEEPQSNDA